MAGEGKKRGSETIRGFRGLSTRVTRDGGGIAKATFNLLRTMRKELRTAPTPPTGITPTPQQSTVSQAELRKRDALEWKKLKDVAKALGWVWDRMNEVD